MFTYAWWLAVCQSSWAIEREGRGSECEIDAYILCAHCRMTESKQAGGEVNTSAR